MDSARRSIAKTLTWRALAVTVTACVAWAATGNLGVGVSIGMLDSLVKLVGYYAHERLWNRIGFGTAAQLKGKG